MKVSFVIPVHEKDNCFLKRCILSIKDQDYKDYDVTVVGYANKQAKKVCETLGANYYEAYNENASVKRNLGAERTDGDVLFFFDADCTLLPGILRIVVNAFEDNPDCGFVYGAYRWNVESLNTYPSRPFDPYLLQTNNYISTMSPIKREVFPKFNEDLGYFQDWDLFLRVTRSGVKGRYLPDVLFMTEPTDARSISGNGKVKYLDKVRHVHKVNGIEDKKICLTTLGAPYQTIQRAKCLNADYFGCHRGSSLIQIPSMFQHEYKMIYAMGFYPTAVHDHAKMFANAPKDCLRVVQWIGTDVHQLRTRFNWETLKYLRDKVINQIDVQLCNSDGLRDELGELGIKAHTVYMPLLTDVKVSPLPKKFTVGVYYSDTNLMHNEEFLVDVAKSMPDVNFLFFGGSKVAKEENIEYVAWSDIQSVINRCSVNVRVTTHDGFPHTPVHFLLTGRPVITNNDMPYMTYVPMAVSQDTFAECKVKLTEKIREVKKDMNQEFVKTANDYYRGVMDRYKYKEIVYGILDKGKEFVFQEGEVNG